VFPIKQPGIDATADLRPRFGEHFEQGARAPSFIRRQCGSVKTCSRLKSMQLRENFYVELVRLAHGREQGCSELGAHYSRSQGFENRERFLRALVREREIAALKLHTRERG